MRWCCGGGVVVKEKKTFEREKHCYAIHIQKLVQWNYSKEKLEPLVIPIGGDTRRNNYATRVVSWSGRFGNGPLRSTFYVFAVHRNGCELNDHK